MAIRRALVLACAALFVGACAEIEVSDCEGIDRRSRCEDAEVESGECRWVDVYTPFPDAGGCDLGAPEVASAVVSAPDSPGAPLEVAAPVASLLGAPEVPTAAPPSSDAVHPSADAVPENATPSAACCHDRLGMRTMQAR